MKINPVNNPNIIKNYTTKKTSVYNAYQASGDIDKVSVSEQALSFSKVLSSVKADFEVRSSAEQSKIDDIANRIKEGTYHVDSASIAEKMLRDILSE